MDKSAVPKSVPKSAPKSASKAPKADKKAPKSDKKAPSKRGGPAMKFWREATKEAFAKLRNDPKFKEAKKKYNITAEFVNFAKEKPNDHPGKMYHNLATQIKEAKMRKAGLLK